MKLGDFAKIDSCPRTRLKALSKSTVDGVGEGIEVIGNACLPNISHEPRIVVMGIWLNNGANSANFFRHFHEL
jgi:hypothetical protein